MGKTTFVLISAALSLGLVSPSSARDDVPSFVTAPIERIVFDGVDDDLLTAGLGRDGLAGAEPQPADPENPTSAELRRLSIHASFAGLLDRTPGGGYGRLYGPGVDDGGEGKVAGVEYRALATLDGSHGPVDGVVLLVQIPAEFDPATACIVTAPSSGSRGAFGAVATVGEWALQRGCAVAYTDKGAGSGVHDLARDRVGLLDGRRVSAAAAGDGSTFTAPLSRFERERLLAFRPHRLAFKHAHSRANPEAAWGRAVLASVEFAFHVLRREYPEAEISPSNAIVIGSSVSNGGGASLRAAELDADGLIDGVVVSEPNITPAYDPEFAIVVGESDAFFAHSRPLFAYTAVMNLYLGCASARRSVEDAPFNASASPERCRRLAALGLVSGQTTEAQAADAQAKLRAYGFAPEQDRIAPSHWSFGVPQAIGVTYASAYARASVEEAICGYGFAAVDEDARPARLSDAQEARLGAASSGIPRTANVEIIAERAEGGPIRADATPAQDLDGHLCLAALAFGVDPVAGGRLEGRMAAYAARIAESLETIQATGDLGGRPAIIVNGRADAVLPPNHASRPYFGLNQRVEGSRSRLSYIEVLNAQHLDALNAFDDFAPLYLPLHHYFRQALDLMLAHLRDGARLPPSQVIRTVRREAGANGLAPATVEANLPPIVVRPAPGDAIRMTGDRLIIPD
ncbi:MAG: 3-hydroxybutyrate oligomer hydrolase family protein [Pseudomonadota bacterium]